MCGVFLSGFDLDTSQPFHKSDLSCIKGHMYVKGNLRSPDEIMAFLLFCIFIYIFNFFFGA